jgi:nucleoside-triphosphatase
MNKGNSQIKNILITGNPGVGKTTLIKSIVSKLNMSVGGFYTAEIRDEKGKRWGFKIISLDGEEGIMASVEIISKNRVSNYGVDIEVIDSIGVKAIEKAFLSKDLIVIDEIGRMELFSKRFQDIIIKALDSPKLLLGTITVKDTIHTKKIKDREDTKIIKLKRENYTEIETYLRRLIQEY